MSRINDYKIITQNDCNVLAKQVVIYMKQGWVPQGSPYATQEGDTYLHHQALIKYKIEIGDDFSPQPSTQLVPSKSKDLHFVDPGQTISNGETIH